MLDFCNVSNGVGQNSRKTKSQKNSKGQNKHLYLYVNILSFRKGKIYTYNFICFFCPPEGQNLHIQMYVFILSFRKDKTYTYKMKFPKFCPLGFFIFL